MPTPASVTRGSLKECQGQGWVCAVCPATRKGQPFFLNHKAALKHERIAHNHSSSAADKDKNVGHEEELGVLSEDRQTADGTCRDEIDHAPLTSEGLRQWAMHAHVDHVYDLVPFWQCGIDAAEKGQVLRLEEFLDKMEGDGGWRTTHEVLGTLGGCQWKAECAQDDGGWGAPHQGDWAAGSQRRAWESNGFDWAGSQKGGWGIASAGVASDATESSSQTMDILQEWARSDSDLKVGRLNAVQESCGVGVRLTVEPGRAVQGDGRRKELRHFVDVIARQEAVNEERRKQMHLFFEMTIEQKVQKIQETIRFLRTHGR